MGSKELTTTQGKSIIEFNQDALESDILQEVQKYSGCGISSDAADQLIPFLVILQDMSPQVKKRDPSYIDGAEPGMVFQTASRKLYLNDTGVLFQPCHFAKMWVEWVPRTSGGGFVAQHADKPADAVDYTEEKEGRSVRGCKRSNGNELVETRYHFGHILDDGKLEPAVVSMSSTGHTASRQWMTMMSAHVLHGHRAPSWFRAYRLKSTTKKNAQGEWFTWAIEDVGWISDKNVREQGRLLFESVRDGQKHAAAPSHHLSTTDDEIPF